LTHLEVYDGRLVELNKLEKLEHLKISGLGNLALELENLEKVAPLKRLSILHLEQNEMTFNEFAIFIQRFSGTLVDLHLAIDVTAFKDVTSTYDPDSHWGYWGVAVHRHEGPNITENQGNFPHLKTLAYPYPHTDESFMSVLKYFLGKAPALETIKMTQCYNGFASWSIDYCWGMCGGLKEMVMYERRDDGSSQTTIYRDCDLDYLLDIGGRTRQWRGGLRLRCKCDIHSKIRYHDGYLDADSDVLSDSDEDAEEHSD